MLSHSLGSAAVALRQLAAARHVGKIVAAAQGSLALSGSSSAGSWVISGGTGALGALSARHLVANRVRQVVLLSRSGTAGSALADVASASGWAAMVTVAMCDAAVAADAAAVWDAQGSSAVAEVHGVLHAGGVLKDATLQRQTWSAARAVLAPKVHGMLSMLGLAAEGQPLHAVKLFSSVAALLGSGGQANYAAANALLDLKAGELQEQVRYCFLLCFI